MILLPRGDIRDPGTEVTAYDDGKEEIRVFDAKEAYWYARNIIKDRWEEGEEIIKTDPCWAYWYARNAIKGRWPEAEETIKTDPGWWEEYRRYCL